MTIDEHNLRMLIVAKNWPAVRAALHRGTAPKARRLTVRRREFLPVERGAIARQKLAYAAGNNKSTP